MQAQAQAQDAVEVDYERIKDYNTVMIEEQQFAMVLFLLKAKEREKLRQERYNHILNIKDKLRQILETNEAAEEPDRLDRHEIVIDVESRDQIINKGEMCFLYLQSEADPARVLRDRALQKRDPLLQDQVLHLGQDERAFKVHQRPPVKPHDLQLPHPQLRRQGQEDHQQNLGFTQARNQGETRNEAARNAPHRRYRFLNSNQ